MKLEYVASGLSLTRIVENSFRETDNTIETTNKYIKDLREEGTLISALFNAYTETNFGEILNNEYKEFYNIFSDSGGLQVVTLNRVIDDELKNKIYKIQSDYSTVAMSFDEIPVITLDETGSKRGDNSTRRYDDRLLKINAKKSGENLNTQIEAFKNYGTSTKPMLIAQGNDRFSIAEWVDIVYNTVSKENRKYIHGIAFAYSSIGSGTLEAIETCAAYGLIPYEEIKNNIHLLGVGSLRKLIPYIECYRSGFFKSDTTISIDSTSHTQGIIMGSFMDKDLRTRSLGKSANKFNEKIFKEIYRIINRYYTPKASFDEYYKYVTDNINTSRHLRVDHLAKDVANLTYSIAPFLQANYLVQAVKDCYNNNQAYEKYLNQRVVRRLNPLRKLGEVKNNDDMEYWFKNFSRYVQSERIQKLGDEIVELF